MRENVYGKNVFVTGASSGIGRACARLFAEKGCIVTGVSRNTPETEEDFAETMRFAKEMAFAQMHLFRYSPRPGTKAAAYPGQVPESVKKERADLLSVLAGQMQQVFLQGCVGKEMQVLFERERRDGFHRGHAENYALVCVPDTDGTDRRGAICPVYITGTAQGRLLGKLCVQEKRPR